MRQQSFTDNNIEKFRKKTRKELFLDHLDHIIPWQNLTAAIESFYPKPKGVDRRIENLITRRLKGRFADKDDTHAFHRGQKRIFSSGIVRIYGSNPVPEHKVLQNGMRPYVRVNILRLKSFELFRA
ncbi:MAG: hypothetical protein KZQ73_01810 [Candidatus Thiodiazotropha sp. (ex Semelilucina semeliformis)]|nr:hypothetical protein [Candidatus Thiodiazotropha sp. (ex Semelilucina semeliformis)]